ncbi:MAG: hypothetical protein GXX79_13790 [Actinomycetales bacterium]|nr:hypothetical protein [Actinomycetales bacterium]
MARRERELRTVNYAPEDRPFVYVRHDDGRWYAGRLHAWVPVDDAWRCIVSYHTGPGVQYYRDVPADDVRRHDNPPDAT